MIFVVAFSTGKFGSLAQKTKAKTTTITEGLIMLCSRSFRGRKVRFKFLDRIQSNESSQGSVLHPASHNNGAVEHSGFSVTLKFIVAVILLGLLLKFFIH